MPLKLPVALIALVMLAVGASAAASPANGDPLTRQARSATELQAQINRQLELVPGGKQTAPNEVSYSGGRFVVTYAQPGVVQPMAADCPDGWFCFYDRTNFGYPRGRLSDPGWQDLATWNWYNRVESVHNATSTAVDFREHTDVGHEPDLFLFCVPSYGTAADVAPFRNMADHVERYYELAHCN